MRILQKLISLSNLLFLICSIKSVACARISLKLLASGRRIIQDRKSRSTPLPHFLWRVAYSQPPLRFLSIEKSGLPAPHPPGKTLAPVRWRQQPQASAESIGPVAIYTLSCRSSGIATKYCLSDGSSPYWRSSLLCVIHEQNRALSGSNDAAEWVQWSANLVCI